MYIYIYMYIYNMSMYVSISGASCLGFPPVISSLTSSS